ncbi:hypothetical protein FOXYSP1_07500 [Fusarium oxysporum f. sp. phaseoli]
MLHVFCSASVGCNLSLTYAFSREFPKHRHCQGFKYLAKKKKSFFHKGICLWLCLGIIYDPSFHLCSL